MVHAGLHQWLHHLPGPQAAVPLFPTFAGAAYKVSAFMPSLAISLLSCLSWVFCFFFFATDSSKESFFKGKLRKMMGAEGTSQVVEAGGSRGLKYPHLLPPSACCLPTSVPWGPKPLAAGSWALVDEAS